MSQWSEKIPKENLSKTVSSTGYFFTSFSEVWIQINNFRNNSRKFIIDLLTKNAALNLSGAIFFVGLGYSLKWWYKDQLFVVLLKQNLPALSQSQKNISWDYVAEGESMLNNDSVRSKKEKILLQQHEKYQARTPLIDRIDLDANHIRVTFKQPWQKHVSERFVGVFSEPAQANISKQVLTTPFTREKDWWRENTLVINNHLSSDAYKGSVGEGKLLKKKSVLANANITPTTHTSEPTHSIPRQIFDLARVWGVREGVQYSDKSSDKSLTLHYLNPLARQGNGMYGQTPCKPQDTGRLATCKACGPAKFSTYTLLNPEGVSSTIQFKPIFPKKWFKLSPRNLYSLTALNQKVILPPLGSETSEQKSPFSKFSKMWPPLLCSARNPRPVARMIPGWKSWRSEAAEQINKSIMLGYLNPLQIEKLYGVSSADTSTDKLSYPLQLTKKLAGWQPFPNLLILNSYLDEIPYKLENVLQSYFPKKNSQLLFLSTSFRKSVNSRIPFRSTAMNDVAIKSNSVNTLPSEASVSNPSVLQGKSFTRYLPILLQQNVYPLQVAELTPCKPEGTGRLKLENLYGNGMYRLATCRGRGQLNYDSLLQQHEDRLEEELVIEELKAPGTDVNIAKHCTGLLYKLKNSWVSDSSANYKSSKTENNETEKILDLFKETFLVPTKQSETYLKKLHLFETKKLLRNQFASLINSFSIDFVEKSEALLEKDTHSHTGNELASPHILFPDKSSICKGLRRNSLQIEDLSGIVLTNCGNEIVNESVAKGYEGTKVDRLTQLFAYSNVANAANAEGLDPLLLLNTLGFTFNNFSPLTNPPILLSYDKLGVVSNRVTNIFKPARDNNSATVAKHRNVSSNATLPKESENSISYKSSICTTQSVNPIPDKSSDKSPTLHYLNPLQVAELTPSGLRLEDLSEDLYGVSSATCKEFLGNFDNEIINDGSLIPEEHASDLLYKLLCVAKDPQRGVFDSCKSISFYFNPKDFNWIVFQHSTNDKFNLFLKKISVPWGEINKENNEINGRITSDQPVTTQLTKLVFEFLKGKTGLSYVYPFGLEKDNYVDNKGGNNFTNYLPEPNWQSKEEVVEKDLLQQVRSSEDNVRSKEEDTPYGGVEGIPEEFQRNGVVQIEDLSEFCQRINCANELANPLGDPQSPTACTGDPKEFRRNCVNGMRRKLGDLIKTNTIINKVDRFTISNNVNKISFKQKETKIKYPTPDYKINLVDKDINFDKNSRYMSGYVYPDIQSNSLKAFLYQWLSSCTSTALKGLQVAELTPYPVQTVGDWGVNTQAKSSDKSEICTCNLSNAMLVQLVKAADSFGSMRQRFVRHCAISNQFLGNNHYLVNVEVPYKKFNHYLAKFPGFSDPNQFFITLPQISCGNQNLVNESQEKSILSEPESTAYLEKSSTRELNRRLVRRVEGLEVSKYAYPPHASSQRGIRSSEDLLPTVAERNDSINIIDKSEINKKFIQKNGCDSRKIAYSGIVVRRNKWTKDFQPFKDEDNRYKKELFKEHPHTQAPKGVNTQARVDAGASKSSIWGTLFLGAENPLNDRQCHFFGQKQLSTLDTNSLQRDYLRQLGKEILTQSNSKGYTELSKFSSIERTKILSLSKKVNSFFFKKRKYSYLLEPKDQWHLLFQEQLCTALEDCKKYPLSTEEINIEKLNADSGRIKISAPLIMVRFPKKLVQSPSPLRFTSCINAALKGLQIKDLYPEGMEFQRHSLQIKDLSGMVLTNCVNECVGSVPNKLTSHQLEQGISWRPFCHLVDPLQRIPQTNLLTNLLTNRRFSLRVGGLHAVARGYPLSFAPVAKGGPHYPLFTERFSEEINAVPCLNKNSLFYSSTDSLTISSRRKSLVTDSVGIKVADSFGYKRNVAVTNQRFVPRRACMRWKNMKSNFLGIQNMCTSWLIQKPLTLSYSNSWAVLNQWVFLIALLFWVEQTLLNNVFPALFALEQILLSAAGLRTGENNRTQVLRISKNEIPKFQNLAGIDGLLGELSELVLFLRGQQNLEIASSVPFGFWSKWNKKNSYGVLLTGSPGTGKTFLVRALANEAKVPVLILSASTLTASKLNNNKPSWSIRHAFKRAKQLAPCILFIDEIDALGKSRGKIVTDINEIVADTTSLTPSGSASASASFLTHKLTKSTQRNFTNPLAQQMFSYEQFGQNWSNFNATLLNKWEYPLQSIILQESNEINQNSLCQEKLVDLLKIVGGFSQRGSTFAHAGGNGTFTPSGSEASKSLAEFKKESTNETTYSRSHKGAQQLPRLEKEMTRSKFGPLTQLLVSMDGVSSFSGVLIMGATNRPELLDPALTRPGRFEKIIRIDKPSEQNRIEILQLYSQNLGVQQQIPWSYLATRTIGLTTADLAVAMNYSSLRAIIQDSVHTLETIEYGLNCITRY